MNSKVTLGIRILVGLAMVVFGFNKIVPFMPQPEPGAMGASMQALMGALTASPFMKIIALIEIVGGLALIANKYVPLALTLLVAVMFNALLIHLFYDPKNAAGAGVFLALCLVLVYANKERFKDLLSA
jgi:putative oxidoreductase